MKNKSMQKQESKYQRGERSEGIRLNKYIANTGLCSRREADELIRAGLISVNGKVITILGTKVAPSDVIKYDGKILSKEKKVSVRQKKSDRPCSESLSGKGISGGPVRPHDHRCFTPDQ
jgi:23S rRNA pseudouridine2605 synthase